MSSSSRGIDGRGWHEGPPPGYGYGPGGVPPHLSPRRKRKWPWVLLALGLVCLAVLAGCVAFISSAADQASEGTDPASLRTVSVQVISDGAQTANSVTFTWTDEKGQLQQRQDNGPVLPWSEELALPDSWISSVSLTAQAAAGADSISCIIREGDEVLTENTSTGEYAVVTCSGGAQ